MSRGSASFFALCSLLGVAIPGSALAGKADFHLDTTADAPARLQIDMRWLDVHVRPVSGDKVTVKADVLVETSGTDKKAQKCLDKSKVHLEPSGDVLKIRQGDKDSRDSDGCVFFGFGRISGRLEVGVPAGIPLEVETASGEVEARGDFGAVPVAIRVASGDVKFEGQASELELDTASGDATLVFGKPVKRLEADLASGSLRMSGGAEEVKASAASGDIRLENLSGTADVETASGDINLSWDRIVSGSKISAEAASGDVTLTVPTGTALGGRLETSSGSLHTDVLGRPGPERGVFQLEGTDGHVDIETASGDITLRTR